MSNSSEPKQAFESMYLQRITAELAEDLETLRTSEDFTKPAKQDKKATQTAENQASHTNGNTAAASSSNHHHNNNNNHADDSPLDMLIAALRQGAEMFGPEEQRRVLGQ